MVIHIGKTIDDGFTAFTGCGIACQEGYEDEVGWGWRIVAGFSFFLPFGNKALKKAGDFLTIQGHHLIPKTFANKQLHPLVELAQQAGFDVDNYMIHLPDSFEWSNIIGLPKHLGSHSEYNDFLKDILDNAYAISKSQQWTSDDAYRYLEGLANDLFKLLSSGGGTGQKFP